MTRAIRLSCLALLFVALGAASALAKPTIAVLGLEVVDKAGTPTPVDTQVAQELTTGLRLRAKAGTGPYQIAPNSDKELVDEKLLKNCDDEKPTCMAAIGNELNADFLMYGRIEKQGGAYQVTINLLDVKRKQREKSIPQPIPIAESSGAALQVWAKKIYAALTGQTDTCTLVIKTTGGVDKGTILVNNEPKGNISVGNGEVKGLAEGKYTVAVEAKDFHRYENSNVTCTAGQTTTISPEMTKIEIGTGAGSGSGSAGEGSGAGSGSDSMTGSYTHPKSHKGIWKAVAWGAAAGTAIAGGVWAYAYFADIHPYSGNKWEITDAQGHTQFSDANYNVPKLYGPDQCSDAAGLENNPDVRSADAAAMHDNAFGIAGVKQGNKAFAKACSGYSITKFMIPTTIGLAVVAGVAFVMASRSADDKESAVQVSGTGSTKTSGRRTKRAPFAIVPVVGPTGGGASFAMEW
jgi:hypothetical protein